MTTLTSSRGTVSGRGTGIALATICTLLFLTFLDNTVISVALGVIQQKIGGSATALQWVIGAYALTFASLMLGCGMLGDKLGRKKVMLVGSAVFCAGSVVCATARDTNTLIAGRAIMGVGAAASEPGTLSMLRQIFPDERARARAIGVWAGVSGLALAMGPVVGGILVGIWGWPSIFWFNLLFGLLAMIAAAVVLPESRDPHAGRIDLRGTLMWAGALASLVSGIISAETKGFHNLSVIGMLAGSAIGTVNFIRWERKAPAPLLDLKFFRDPRFTIPNLCAMFSYFATYAVFSMVAVYLEEAVSATGFEIAAAFLPMTVVMIVSSLVTGRRLPQWGPRLTMTAGCAFFGVGLLVTTRFINPHPSYAGLSFALALVGVGIGVTVVPVTTLVLAAVPGERSGMAAGAANTSREMGAVVGVAVLGALITSRLVANLVVQLKSLGLPPAVQKLVISGVQGGAAPSGQQGTSNPLILKIIHAAFAALGDSINTALDLSAVLVLFTGLLTALFLKDKRYAAKHVRGPRPADSWATIPKQSAWTGPATARDPARAAVARPQAAPISRPPARPARTEPDLYRTTPAERQAPPGRDAWPMA